MNQHIKIEDIYQLTIKESIFNLSHDEIVDLYSKLQKILNRDNGENLPTPSLPSQPTTPPVPYQPWYPSYPSAPIWYSKHTGCSFRNC